MAQQAETRRSATSVVGRVNYQGALDRDPFSAEDQLTKHLSVYGQVSDLLSGGYADRFLIYDKSQSTPDYAKLDRIIEHGVSVTVGIKGTF